MNWRTWSRLSPLWRALVREAALARLGGALGERQELEHRSILPWSRAGRRGAR